MKSFFLNDRRVFMLIDDVFNLEKIQILSLHITIDLYPSKFHLLNVLLIFVA